MNAGELRKLAKEINCGLPFTLDLSRLAGGDAALVREASEKCRGAESVKAYIIDKRFKKNGM